MAYYSKRGYITFWECIPIFQGMYCSKFLNLPCYLYSFVIPVGLSYTTALVTLFMEMNNISEAGITILYICKTFYGVPWKECNFAGADENCIPHHPKFNVSSNNCQFASNQYNK